MPHLSRSAFHYPAHGGDLDWAQREFGFAKEQWLDLSTGLSPWVLTLPDIPTCVLTRLPADDHGLKQHAAAYYGCDSQSLVPIPGTSIFIAAFPRSVKRGCVALPQQGYKAHEQSWQSAGHQLVFYSCYEHLIELITDYECDYVVVINPNNPTGEFWPPTHLHELHSRLSKNRRKKATLIVDEAFIDAMPDASLISSGSMPDNLIILRSFGKFFGYAGLRVGFVICAEGQAKVISGLFGPWAISGVGRWVAEKVLHNSDWIAAQKARIYKQSAALELALKTILPEASVVSAGLFVSVAGKKTSIEALFIWLAERAVFTRLINVDGQHSVLRFGLPGENFAKFITVFACYDTSFKW